LQLRQGLSAFKSPRLSLFRAFLRLFFQLDKFNTYILHNLISKSRSFYRVTYGVFIDLKSGNYVTDRNINFLDDNARKPIIPIREIET
jgi:hypothetical protein